MAKFDMSGIVTTLQKKLTKSPQLAAKIGLGSRLRKLTEKDFLIMPAWWQEATKTLGLPFGAAVMLAGRTDSGKTTAAIEAMKAAQAQGVGIIYVETENKTTEEDLKKKGVDSDQVIIVRSTIAEEAFDLMFKAWDEFKRKYPDAPLLIIFDSIGNTVSMRDADLDMTDGKEKPGGKGKSNRLGMSKLIAKFERDTNVAMLIVNYTYANMGSPGRTNAGGEAVSLFASLIYQTTRRAWLEKTVGGQKVRVGAAVQWTLYKNHIHKDNPGPKQILLEITSKGVEYVSGSSTQEAGDQDESDGD